MLWNLEVSWLFFAIVTVAMIGFMLGMALDGVMGDDGFGAVGNMLVITTGFFLAVFVVNSYGISLRDLTLATATGLAGAFVTLASLAILKATLNRA